MKSKKARTNQLAELRFVSTLELEQSVDLIADLGEDYPVTLTVRDPDTIDFGVRYSHGEIKGTLQRWAGNETRINCSGDVIRVEYNDDYSHSVTPITQLAGIGLCMIMASSGHLMLGVISMATISIIGSWYRPRYNKRRSRIVPIFRERDAIFQQIIDSFKASGEVSPS